MTYQKDPNEIGALWQKQSASGNEFMSGSIEIDGKQIRIVCFANNKRKENQPDWKILISKPKEEKEKPQYGFTDATKSEPEPNIPF